MTIDRGILNKFNRGEVAKEAFGREDVSRLQNSCELMRNFQPERLGPMRFRPGTEQIESITNTPYLVPFVTRLEDPVILAFRTTSGGGIARMQVIRDDEYIILPVRTTGWANPFFQTDYAPGEWINADEGSAISVINFAPGSTRLELTGTGSDSAKSYQTSTVTETGEEHAFTINVDKGSVNCKIGTSGVDSIDIFEGDLSEGLHYLFFTPSADFTITIANDKTLRAEVGSCFPNISPDEPVVFSLLSISSDTLNIGFDGLRSLRYAQVANDIYFASKSVPPFVIRRRGGKSFSMELYKNVNGPYEPINISSITMNPTAPIDGDTEVVSSSSFFNDGTNSIFGFDDGTLLKLAVAGQNRTATGSDNTVETLGIFVFGTGNARRFNVEITADGTFAEVRLEKSFDEITWQRVNTYTSNTNVVYDDGLDAAETFYRLQVEDFTGTATTITLTLSYDFGVIESQGRIVERVNDTTVNVEWFDPLTVDQTVRDWSIGSWGGNNEYPTAVAFYESRLWFAGNNKVWGSESDFYESFNRNVEGNSASIERTIGFGSSEEIFWLAPSARLVAGNGIAEIDVRSTTFGEVLSDTNTNLKPGSDEGCANLAPVVFGQEIIFVQRGGNKLIGINFNIQSEKHDLEDFTTLNPEILNPSVVRMAFSKNPETRIYLVLSDGTMRVMLREPNEDVLSWSRIDVAVHDGVETVSENILDVCVIPGTPEDRVYIVTEKPNAPNNRNGRILKFAQTTEADGSSASKHFDNFTSFTSPGTTITLDPIVYPVGVTVAAWVDGNDDGEYVVNGSNEITGVTAGTDVIVGFRYDATYKSNKLGDYTSASILTANKRIINTGLIMADYIQGSIEVGPDFDSLSPLPAIEDGKPAENDDDYDHLPFGFDGESETDPRIHIKATGPCNILALSYEVKDTDRRPRRQGQ